MEYRPGRYNTVADAGLVDAAALPPDCAAAVLALSGPMFALLDEVRRATPTAPDCRALLDQLQAGELGDPWHVVDGVLLHGSRVFAPDHGDLRQQVLLLAHSAGHEGIQKTLHRLRAHFFFPCTRLAMRASKDAPSTPRSLLHSTGPCAGPGLGTLPYYMLAQQNGDGAMPAQQNGDDAACWFVAAR